jgi:hypothetical protein
VRQLSNVIDDPVLCRKRACRRAERCQGGYGPALPRRRPRSSHMRNGLREMRRFWKRQRTLAAQRSAQATHKTAAGDNGGGLV